MKFPRFYNPFRRIRELEATVARLWAHNNNAVTANAQLREARDSFEREADVYRAQAASAYRSVYETSDLLGDAYEEQERLNQAVDAHMDERRELKTYIQVQNFVGEALVQELLVTRAALEVAATTLADHEQASAEAVAYVKSVEASLRAGGITVEDAEDGPRVVVNQDLFLQRLREKAFTVVTEDLEAA